MNPQRPNLTTVYVLITAAGFCFVGVAIALLGGYVELPVAARNLIIVAAFGVTVASIAILSAVVIAVQAICRTPTNTRELIEIRDQLSHIGGMLRDRDPNTDEEESRQMAIDVARLQQNTAQSQQDLSQLQEMMRQVIAKLDALRSVATTPSPAAAALDREADEAEAIAIASEQEPIRLSPEEEVQPIASTKPRLTFRPTLAPDELPVEAFDSLDAARARVDDLMALSNWDQALAIAANFAEEHEDDADAQWLRQRVQREFDIYREGSVRRLYEQIKDELERKHYRRALSIARRLLDKFPDHRKAQKIRQQLPTILENAEIEERQEEEQRIQSYIKAKRFADAVELGEALLAKYPTSPQAESLEDMLPRLRQLAIEQEADSMARR